MDNQNNQNNQNQALAMTVLLAVAGIAWQIISNVAVEKGTKILGNAVDEFTGKTEAEVAENEVTENLGGGESKRCSICGKESAGKFCPHCGAPMEN